MSSKISTNLELHVDRVKLDFRISSRDLIAETLTETIGVEPILTARRGDERKNYSGQLVSPHVAGLWVITSELLTTSKDINNHFKALFEILLPHADYISGIYSRENAEIFFDVMWESNYLYAGSGPILSRATIGGVAQLNGEIGFDIYQIDESD